MLARRSVKLFKNAGDVFSVSASDALGVRFRYMTTLDFLRSCP
jgi:hypothetical protein